MLRRAAALLALAALTACGPAEPRWADEDLVQRSIYRPGGPPALTLYTVVSTETGRGAHSSLLVNADQQVLFDPAGTFVHPLIPERNDVIIGVDPVVLDYYTDYHARRTFDVVAHRIEVTPEVAALAMQLVTTHGAVRKAECARQLSAILQQLPGFQSIDRTWYPRSLQEDFAALPGVETWTISDPDDPDDNTGVLIDIDLLNR